MKKRYFCLLMVFCGLLQNAYAQQSLSGNIVDSSENMHLSNTVIAVLRKADSVLVKYTRSDQQGKFSVQSLPPGKFILMVTHPKYADYVDELEIKGDPIDIGNIFMTLRSQLLQEVIVTNAAAIRLKGDTIEYKADSFYLSDGATVEDLLKKLPGIQVDKNGKITAHGETVQKVLVDGEEFFSDDPTVVTQNMLSDAIDKVQVYDKKSDQAVFTGIDDGQKQK
ncbi:MAG TPA: carboxypeptidase regulatory-like domain-containing protein, partial [Flavitalea sp.]|nr:carboxypeptidase regulatory-like domain-containing protein [Flavitalea sp.]